MAVSSLSRDFRKIDIEQYADDFYVDDEPDNSLAGPDEMAVQSAINGGQQQVSIHLGHANVPDGNVPEKRENWNICVQSSQMFQLFSKNIFGTFAS